MNKTFNLSKDVLEKVLQRKKTTYDSLFRELLGMPQEQQNNSKVDKDYIILKGLKVGQSCRLEFIYSDEISRNMKPINVKKLSQLVRRVQEKFGYRFFVEGSPRGQIVTRIA